MAKLNKRQLHQEDTERYKKIHQTWKTRGLDYAEIFKYPQVPSLISFPGARVHYRDIENSLFSLALHHHVVVPICHACDVNVRTLKPVLESGCVLPVLSGTYRQFSAKVLNELVLYPHISRGEHLIGSSLFPVEWDFQLGGY